MKILALDLGKRRTVACEYHGQTGEHQFHTIPTTATAIHDLIISVEPSRVVFEISPSAGWIADLVRGLGIELQVANANHQAWRWRSARKKNDRVDALKLAQLSTMNQLGLVHVPQREVRQWRSLIAYRHQLVARRTQIKNNIRATLEREGVSMPEGAKGWSPASIDELRGISRPLGDAERGELWRVLLGMELDALINIETSIESLEQKLDALAEADRRCRLLRTIPGVGPRLAEMVVAVLDDPKRFHSGRQVGAYVGLTPRQFQSGDTNRQGRISGQGHKRLRALLVEVSWIGLRYNPWMREVYENARRGSPTRKKIAIVAAARRLLVCCWAMLRDHQPWRPPTPVPAAAQA